MGRPLITMVLLTVSFGDPVVLRAQEIGHFAPGILGIRDFAMPAAGFYGLLYTYSYSSDRLNDANGNEIDAVTIRPGAGSGTTVNVDVNVDAYAIAPTLIWVSGRNVLGAKYGAYISPAFGNTSVAGALRNASGSGRSAEESQFGLGDLFVQPLWLGWTREMWDFALGYGFYAPVGKYDIETVTFPVVGPVKVEAADNIGLGFWTHQFQGAASWYPWTDRRMAVPAALTYEIHREKDGFDLTPGQNLTLNWGVSQYLPLRKDQTLLLELGPAGYSTWQISDDSGANAADRAVHDEVHAVGGQLGLTHVPWNAALNFRFLFETASRDRFEGQSIGLNVAVKF
jgi:hypothetical protein